MSKGAKIIQVVLLIAVLAAGINFYLAMRERRIGFVAPNKPQIAIDPDYYVTPKKLHPQDVKDARELTRQPAWIREGYRFTYYPYNGHTDFAHPAGTLGPIEKLDIVNVVVNRPPDAGSQPQVMAVIKKNDRLYAFPIGVEEHGNSTIYSDDILFIQDPHQLYKHWPGDVWKAIDEHQMKPGMNELQASFAIGMGAPEGLGMGNPRVVDYPNGGHPLRVTYDNGKATEIAPGS